MLKLKLKLSFAITTTMTTKTSTTKISKSLGCDHMAISNKYSIDDKRMEKNQTLVSNRTLHISHLLQSSSFVFFHFCFLNRNSNQVDGTCYRRDSFSTSDVSFPPRFFSGMICLLLKDLSHHQYLLFNRVKFLLILINSHITWFLLICIFNC